MDWGPPSVTVSVGDKVSLPCRHNSNSTNITWWRVPQGNSTWPPVMDLSELGPKGELIIQQVNKSHRGMYRCEVNEGQRIQRSCGTYLRVRGECLGAGSKVPSLHSWGHWLPHLGRGMEPVPASILTVSIHSGQFSHLPSGGVSGLGL